MNDYVVVKRGPAEHAVMVLAYTPGGVACYERTVATFQQQADAVEYARWRVDMLAAQIEEVQA